MSVQSSLKGNLSIPSLPSQNPGYKSFKSCSSLSFNNKGLSTRRIHKIFASAVAEAESVEVETSESVVQEIEVKNQLFNFQLGNFFR